MEIDVEFSRTPINIYELGDGECFTDGSGVVYMVVNVHGVYKIDEDFPIVAVNLESGCICRYKSNASVIKRRLKVVNADE